MIRQTGGSDPGEISTKSNAAANAACLACSTVTTPTCSPSAPINRTSRALI